MKVSILTVCLNNESTIEKSLDSLLSQDHPNIEHIVKDGASMDETLSIIHRKSPESKVVSSTDNGLYFALNEAMERATGDIIGILHADDFFTDPGVISDVVRCFEDPNTDAVYGDLLYVDRKDISKVKRTWISGEYKRNAFLRGWMPPHPTFFIRRSLIKNHGAYNTNFLTAADYEWMLRLVQRNGIRLTYLPKVLVAMRIGGQSNATLWKRLRANSEDRMAWRVNDLKPKWYTRWLKPLRKVAQFA
ncbi:MAG: glycosyltransferase family 2 protein [Vicingaceae bacterium]